MAENSAESRQEVFDEVKGLLVRTFALSAGEVTPDASLKELDIDSIDFLDLVADLEKNRKRRFAPRDFAGVRTVGNIVSILTGEVPPRGFAKGAGKDGN
jgi:acyl carrier protein